MDVKSIAQAIADEVAGVVSRVDSAQADALADEIVKARAVFVAAVGRSGLVARAFAMRLMQIGVTAHVAGETATPAMAKGDLLVAVSGSGETCITCSLARSAKRLGGRVAGVVASPGGELAEIADLTLIVPGKAKSTPGISSMQMPGTLFEQSALVVLDAVAEAVRESKGETHADMARRHANLE